MTGFKRLALDGVYLIAPKRHGDKRGYFYESYSAQLFAKAGISIDFCQDNHSYSEQLGVLRGLHYQLQPFAQDKLVRVTRGSVFDVAVDIRVGSPTFGHWVGETLSAENGHQLLVPKGFAHGFVTLEPHVEFLYKVSAPYSQQHDRGIRFDDPAIGIEWPILSSKLVLSEKDKSAPLLANAENNFRFGE